MIPLSRYNSTLRRRMSSYSNMAQPPPLPSKQGIPEAFVYRSEEEGKEGDVKAQFKKFFQDTSFTALVHIYNATSQVKRLIWLLVTLAMLSWLCLQCYWLFSRYFEYPLEVRMDLEAAQELDFPSVTVCNLNPLKESMLYEDEAFMAIHSYMQLESEDSLYSMFNDYYYDDWYHYDYMPGRGGPMPEPSTMWPNPMNPGGTYTQGWATDDTVDPLGGTTEPTMGPINDPSGVLTTGSATSPPAPAVTTSTTQTPTTAPTQTLTAATQTPTTAPTQTPTAAAQTPTTAATQTPTTAPTQTPTAATTTPTTAAAQTPATAATQTQTTPATEPDVPTTTDLFGTEATTGEFETEATTEGLETTPNNPPPPPSSSQPPPPPPPSARRKREARRSINKGGVHSRQKRQVDMSTFLKDRQFNKWDVLENENASSEFYEDRDTEYIASMAFAVFSQIVPKRVIKAGSHPANEFFIGCKMAGFPCSPKNFTTFVNHKYGVCYTFNAEGKGKKVVSKTGGPTSGLTLELYLDQDEYIPALSPAAGVRVLIHPRNSMPFPEDEGISISPKMSTSIGLKQVDITRLPPPHGVCADMGTVQDLYMENMGTSYSKLSCLKSCYQALIIQHCNCSLPQYYVSNNSVVCNLTNAVEETCSRTLPDTQPEGYKQCDKHCPQPCREVRYEKTISTAQWPAQKYASHLQSKVQQSNYMFYGHTIEEDNFAKVEVYYEDLIYQVFEQQKAYESQNLISDVGGQLGLWLGLSAITLGEIFSFIFSLCKTITRGAVKNKKKQSTPIEPYNMPPVSYM